MSHADKVNKYDPPCMIWALSYDIGFSSQGCYKQIVKTIQRNADIVGGIAAGVTAIEVNTTPIHHSVPITHVLEEVYLVYAGSWATLRIWL